MKDESLINKAFPFDQVADPYVIDIPVSANPFTPAESDDIRFLNLAMEDGWSISTSNNIRDHINYRLDKAGGKIANSNKKMNAQYNKTFF